MQKITPYRTLRGARSALDNGGRFYHLFTAAEDGRIEPAELAKVAGVIADRQRMFVFLDMALLSLSRDAAAAVVRSMTPALQEEYRLGKPRHYSPGQANRSGKTGAPAIVTGIPRHVESRSEFSGFIMVPIPMGKGMTFMMVPLTDCYHVYELRDRERGDEFLVAHARGSRKLPETLTTLGGVLKELQGKRGVRPRYTRFLEAFYYCEATS